MTDRMLGAIEESLANFSAKGIRWEAKTLTSLGRGAQESKAGADFMGVLNIDVPGFRVSKGFLAQAKLVRNGSIGSLPKLQKQCDDMLALSPDSFVFVYGTGGVRVIPAISVVSTTFNPLDLYDRSAQRFFEEHLECFIGDRSISAPTPQALVTLRERALARTGILLTAKAGGDR